jgi:hypothetical protein
MTIHEQEFARAGRAGQARMALSCLTG